jgi:hypothetical protein
LADAPVVVAAIPITTKLLAAASATTLNRLLLRQPRICM